MKLVVDANEVFSALIAQGRLRKTKKVELLFSDKVELYSPSLLFGEIEQNRELIQQKANLNSADLDVLIEILKLRICLLGSLRQKKFAQTIKIFSILL